jgi:hypothetical protein
MIGVFLLANAAQIMLFLYCPAIIPIYRQKANLNKLDWLLHRWLFGVSVDSRAKSHVMLRIFLFSGLFFFGAIPFAKLTAQTLPLADWTALSEDGSRVPPTDTVFLGKSCVKLDGHAVAAIWNKALNLKNFRIEFDMAGNVMAGLGFHVRDPQNYQFLYFRPGNGGTIEAVQYIPIYNGALSWVFYGEYQASADIHKLQWFHVTIEVTGEHLTVFTNGSSHPDLSIRILPTDTERGSILLRTLFREAYFANFVYRALPETITDWKISEQLPVEGDYSESSINRVKQWKAIDERGDPYVNLCRYFEAPEGIVIARHVLKADSASGKLLFFDFTGTLRILLNGRELFHYDKFKLERVEAGTYQIRLPLKKGDNDLVFITKGDGFFFGKGYNSLGRLQHQNWGFIAAVED